MIEVHASAGDNFLGGEDFTHMLVDEVLKRADVARTTLNESELAALYACVEAAKCSNQSPLHIRWQYQEETRECEFYENELEDLWLPLLNRLRVPIEQALRDARLKPSQIDSLDSNNQPCMAAYRMESCRKRRIQEIISCRYGITLDFSFNL